MCKILSRIKIIADNEGITIGTIEKAIGASRGVISKAIAKGTDIQSKWLELICEKFPQYSAQWLLTGGGSMMVQSNKSIASQLDAPNDAKIITSTNIPEESLWGYIHKKDQEIGLLHEEIGKLKARIEELQRGETLPPVPVYAHLPEKETVET